MADKHQKADNLSAIAAQQRGYCSRNMGSGARAPGEGRTITVYTSTSLG